MLYKIIFFLFILNEILLVLFFKFYNHNTYIFVKTILPIFFVLFHIKKYMGTVGSSIFIFLSFSIGLIVEIIGVNYGMIFGGKYYYTKEYFNLFICGVPIIIPIYWCIFTYLGYGITNFLAELYKILKNKIYILSIFDSIIIVFLDLIMDPVMVHKGRWHWYDNTSYYFNVPFLNFFSWGVVVFSISYFFRILENKYKFRFKEKENTNILFYGYILVLSLYFIDFFRNNMFANNIISYLYVFIYFLACYIFFGIMVNNVWLK